MSTIPNPPLHLLAAFQEVYPDCSPTCIVQAPGRDTWVAAVTRTEAEGYALNSTTHTGQAKFNRRSAKLKQTLTHRPLPGWSRYAAGVILALDAAGLAVPGIGIVALSEDTSFGPRHDHALGMAVAALWHELCGRPYTPEAILDVVERVRREYVEG